MTMAEEQMKTTHWYKIQPPTHDSNYSRFDQWKYLSRVHQRNIPRLLAKQKHHNRWSNQRSRRPTMGNKTGSLLHLSINDSSSSSSNDTPTNEHQCQRFWNMMANPSKVFHPCWDKRQRLPHQIPQAIVWRISLCRFFCIMGVWINWYERENKVTIKDPNKIAF